MSLNPVGNITGHAAPVQLTDGSDNAFGTPGNPLNVVGVISGGDPNAATSANQVAVQGTNAGVTGNNVFVINPLTGLPLTYTDATTVAGPTAVGSAAANPPVLFGGTANGGAAGNVQVAKVDSSGFL